MGRLTGCKTYNKIQFQSKTGKLVLSNEKLCFQWEITDPHSATDSKSHKSWKWNDLKELKLGSDGKGHRKIRLSFTDDKKDALGFVVLEDDVCEKLKADLSARMGGQRSKSPARSASPTRRREEDTSFAPVVTSIKVVNEILLKPGQQIVQDYVVNPTTNNSIVKALDRTVVQPAKDELALASKKAVQTSNRIIYRGTSFRASTSFDADLSDDGNGKNGDSSKTKPPKAVTPDNFPKYLEKVQKQMREIINSAPMEDQQAMACMLACWAQNLANEPMIEAAEKKTETPEEKKAETLDEEAAAV